jgi:hypothetical protein
VSGSILRTIANWTIDPKNERISLTRRGTN